jgi:hypothetical protein
MVSCCHPEDSSQDIPTRVLRSRAQCWPAVHRCSAMARFLEQTLHPSGRLLTAQTDQAAQAPFVRCCHRIHPWTTLCRTTHLQRGEFARGFGRALKHSLVIAQSNPVPLRYPSRRSLSRFPLVSRCLPSLFDPSSLSWSFWKHRAAEGD